MPYLRDRECDELQRCLESDRSEFVIISGRRRIGKTYLIDKFFNYKYDFKAETWYDAFNALEDYLETLPSDRKKVIFIDEMPWMDTQRSNFVNALFSKADTYISIVKLLSENKSGLTREEIAKVTGLEGSFLSKILKNLERCDFVTRLSHFGSKTRGSIFRLTDFFTLFYYKFIESNNAKDERWWSNNMDSRSVSAWMGLSFELVCLAHHRQIKAALGIAGVGTAISSWRRIAGVGTAISSWRSKTDPDKNMPGFQIDMIIERADRIIHLCEMKFSTDRYAITDNYEMKLRERMGLFRMATKTRKTLVITFVTTYGVVDGKHKSIIHSEVTMDDLFKS